ncbi:hypothetical protein COCMIDRAFT_34137 [Bipolaris oryzae ATCC 44560]|uniref:Uncharacterized protein n=1 Tax=Bipolaris oryzae ATCC 44560 TaxID=930090 RepID=W6ZX83_COCMI|nr:uncharacterized protein COCMIDRAFT_34137 [Bipolaris oryzae ATCC 44560]EUC48456.1 hypothetical protein COCMIDRAFT_34137 [Bipolaris oryzae ATCC 44560]
MPLGREHLCSAAIRWLHIRTVCNIPWAPLAALRVCVAIGGYGLAVATPNLPQHGVHRCMHRWIAPVTRAFPA